LKIKYIQKKPKKCEHEVWEIIETCFNEINERPLASDLLEQLEAHIPGNQKKRT